jgi:hypothetical protein
MVARACHPRYSGGVNWRIEVQAGPGQEKKKKIFKLTKAKMAGGVPQEVEHLPSNHETLSSKKLNYSFSYLGEGDFYKILLNWKSQKQVNMNNICLR